MRFDILTLFPGLFDGFLSESILKNAIEARKVQVVRHDFRQWATDRHHSVDDRPFGGGPGMVLKAEPVVQCVREVQETEGLTPGKLVMFTPQGTPLRQKRVEELAGEERLLLLCGRYEGFDERIRDVLQPEEVSLGDYVLNGGEVAAMALIEAVMRLLPGVLGDELSSHHDSHSGASRLLEAPQYTRPREFEGLTVPEILLSGDHKKIEQWREEQSRLRTQERRPELFEEK